MDLKNDRIGRWGIGVNVKKIVERSQSGQPTVDGGDAVCRLGSEAQCDPRCSFGVEPGAGLEGTSELVFFHVESAMHLIRSVRSASGSGKHRSGGLKHQFAIVKGLSFIEEIVRRNFLKNKTSEIHLTISQAQSIICHEKNSDEDELIDADLKAAALRKVVQAMEKTEVMAFGYQKFSSSRLAAFGDFTHGLKGFRKMESKLAEYLAKERKDVLAGNKGLFNLYPNIHLL